METRLMSTPHLGIKLGMNPSEIPNSSEFKMNLEPMIRFELTNLLFTKQALFRFNRLMETGRQYVQTGRICRFTPSYTQPHVGYRQVDANLTPCLQSNVCLGSFVPENQVDITFSMGKVYAYQKAVPQPVPQQDSHPRRGNQQERTTQ